MHIILLKISAKPSSRYSAFLCQTLFVLFLLLPELAESRVNCRGRDRSEVISRDDIAIGTGTGADRSVSISGAQSPVLINGAADLNIDLDVASLAHNQISKTTDWLWRVQANPQDNLTGYISATYQFSGLSAGDNKICNGTSCLQVTNIQPVTLNLRRFGNNSDPDNGIQKMEQAIAFDLDLSDINLDGLYTGHLEIILSIGPNADGSGSSDLTCDRIFL